MKRVLLITLLAVVLLMGGCGFEGDPVLDDVYSRNIYPGDDSTYNIGREGLAYAEGYFDALYVRGEAVGGGVAGAIMDTDFNAKGDLLTATADDTPIILSVGADTFVLTADSGEASGLKWVATGGGAAADYNELSGAVSTTAAAQGGGNGAWVDWDLSGTLPVGTVAADILIIKLVATDDVGCRTNGSGLARDITALKLQAIIVTVDIAADRIIEIMSADVSDNDTFQLIGYWD